MEREPVVEGLDEVARYLLHVGGVVGKGDQLQLAFRDAPEQLRVADGRPTEAARRHDLSAERL